jgi:hypothetical protein
VETNHEPHRDLLAWLLNNRVFRLLLAIALLAWVPDVLYDAVTDFLKGYRATEARSGVPASSGQSAGK